MGQDVGRALTRREALFVLVGGLAAAAVMGSSGGYVCADESVSKEPPVRHRPKVVAFDVVETLFALDPVRERFKALGLPPGAMQGWFASFLRDAMALEITGVYKPFKEVANATLQSALARDGVEPTPDIVQRVLAGFGELPAHPDVRPAFQALRDAGVRIVTLTNGSAEATTQLLKAAKLDGFVQKMISIDEVRHWKPARDVYLHAQKVTGTSAEELALVAAHAWDIQGAASVGLTTGWVSRTEKRFPPVMQSATVSGDGLEQVVLELLKLPNAS